jgi:hypothetical protein
VNKLALALRILHRAEVSLGRDLFAVADRHFADAEISLVARDLALWPQIHARRLSEAAVDHGAHLSADPRWVLPVLPAASRRFSVLAGRRAAPALLLLNDLRRLHRKAAGTSLDWELVAQSAQAMQAHDLVALAGQCHPQTLRIMRWSNSHLKQLAPQAIAG